MKQHITTLRQPTDPVTDVDVVFTALYNLLYERIEQEPNKGIIICKGQPNERRVKWQKVMNLAHMMEDFFMFRAMRVGDRTCGNCRYFKPTSTASPHMGRCTKSNKEPMHILHCCKNWHSNDKQLDGGVNDADS